MTALESGLRKALEKTVVKARDLAEEGARAALQTLAVRQPDAFPTMTPEQRSLRTALRAKAKNLGEGERERGIAPLVEEIAYEQWHRLLFARFLAENRLLMHPQGGHLSIEECAELAPSEGADNGWDLAGHYAALMLPGIFRAGDPAAQVRLAREYRSQLEGLVADLPVEVFTSEDGLGWTYQFWQAKRKDEVNKAGHKIGARELAPVTQLFTEDYMVRFLLENSLGAWWAARHPHSPLLKEMAYLRFGDDGAPAAGAFPGWPECAAEVTVMDPCCGSGHFLVRAFHLLRRMRMEEEALDAALAGDAVLHNNIFGLELDERCVQIASFALALEAWKNGEYRPIPVPQVTCSGIPVGGQLEDWLRLAGDDENLRQTLDELHRLFRDAPSLGSLIDPRKAVQGGGLFAPDWSTVQRLLVQMEESDKEYAPIAGSVGNVARAARLLSQPYTFAVTNPPFLNRGAQTDLTTAFCAKHFDDAKADLATVFIDRCLELVARKGSVFMVSPQNWLFLKRYTRFRRRLIEGTELEVLAILGEHGFESSAAAGAFVALIGMTNLIPAKDATFDGLDASSAQSATEKSRELQVLPVRTVNQAMQLSNPDLRIVMEYRHQATLLEEYAAGVHGLGTKDSPRFVRCFWEMDEKSGEWEFVQSTVPSTRPLGGMEHVVWWQNGTGILHQLAKWSVRQVIGRV